MIRIATGFSADRGMNRKRRRLLITLGLLSIVAAGFYYFYFVSTEAAVRHAEAFLFSRATVNQRSGQGTYRHFYVTNRVPEDRNAPIDRRFSAERSPELTFGHFDISIRPTLGLGMMLNATDWFQNEEIQIDDLADLNESVFLDSLRQTVDRTPHRSLLIVIHGFRERFPSALRKTAFVSSVLDINTPVMVFDWPGNQGSSLRGYRAARSVAEESGSELARTLELIIREVEPDRLAIIGNSMGAQVIVDAFGELYSQADLADAEVEIDSVVLTAPDVDRADFNEQFKEQIRTLSRQLIVYVSSNDRALLMSRLINRGLRVGESTLSPDMLDEAEMIAQLVEPGSDLVTLIDVTPINRTRNFHNFSLETPEFYDDVFQRLTSDEAPRNRRSYRVQTPEGNIYWVLTRGR
jgi:esterase/lipase superfamily enzyme